MMSGVTATGTVSAEETLHTVERHFHRILEELAAWQATLGDLFAAGPVTSAVATAAIAARVLAFLDGPHHLVGGGFVAARDALADKSLYLAWWQGDDRRLLAEPTLSTSETFDYTRRPWFANPERTGLPHITGPYVDYVCTDEYTVTTTAPVLSGGRLVGVVGADTLVETLERMLLPDLRAIDATLVDAHGRAVISADPHLGPGDPVPPGRRLLPCTGLPLALVLH